MPILSNVIALDDYKRANETLSQQEKIDDIGARAFVFLRNESEALGLSVRDVINEHMLGLAMVVESVEGTEQAKYLLAHINEQLGKLA